MQQDVLLHFWVVFLSPNFSLVPLPVWACYWFKPSSSLGPNQKWTHPEVDPTRSEPPTGCGPPTRRGSKTESVSKSEVDPTGSRSKPDVDSQLKKDPNWKDSKKIIWTQTSKIIRKLLYLSALELFCCLSLLFLLST